jgi:flagellar M-ring protein FliF
MNAAIQQIINIYNRLPLSKKLLLAGVGVLLIAGFGAMFFWANRINYQPLYTNLTPEDAAQVVEKLKEQKMPYQLEGGGTMVMVPAEKVYELRLALAGDGVLKGGTVGYEIFNTSDFGTTEFVQKLNYQRALQGELARTIKEFQEVEDARVMVVMAKDSVFVEETKPPSASVLLKLKSRMSPEKISAVVNLVASAVEDLSPDRVTVVDTTGKVLSKGGGEEQKMGSIASTQFDHTLTIEKSLTQRIQSMLERIVGKGKAIVRVTANVVYDQVDINEEIYDPDVQVVRSRQSVSESSDRKAGPPGAVSSVNPATKQGITRRGRETSDTNKRQDEIVNYEINRTVKRTAKPTGSIKRLSVAVVLDGTYQSETDAEGNLVRKYVARTEAELEQFKKIVQNAMGYSADREDQVTVESFPLAYMDEMSAASSSGVDWQRLLKNHGRTIINSIIIMLIFFFIIRPLIRSVKEIKASVVENVLPSPEEQKALPEPESKGALPEPESPSPQEKAATMSAQNMDKAANVVKGWLNEASS